MVIHQQVMCMHLDNSCLTFATITVVSKTLSSGIYYVLVHFQKLHRRTLALELSNMSVDEKGKAASILVDDVMSSEESGFEGEGPDKKLL